ncbi:MAG: PP2C family protein-serine/threonine phosphatase [Acidimicrobiales bacterium]
MSDGDSDGPVAGAVAELIRQRLAVAEPSGLPAELARLSRQLLGTVGCSLWFADYGDALLRRLPGSAEGPDRPPTAGLGEGAVGTSYLEQQPVVEAVGGGQRAVVPLTARSERLGVLDLEFPPGAEPAALLLLSVADAVASAVVLARPYTDLFDRGRRARDLTLAAEMQWDLLVPGDYRSPRFCLAAKLEPAYEIGGDHYDYAVEPDRLTLAIIDGMGHGLPAAILSSLATAAMRNTRRNGGAIEEQAASVNAAIAAHLGPEAFATGLLVEVDLVTGAACAVNAGHPPAIRLRGGRVVEHELAPQLPFGMFADVTYTTTGFDLAPGDRVILASDGIAEATDPSGAAFGTSRLAELTVATAGDQPVDVVRRVIADVVRHRSTNLADDATVVCLDWMPDAAG